MLIATSCPARTGSFTGSDATTPPAGTVTCSAPANPMRRLEPATVVGSADPVATATRTSVNVTARVPNTFDSRTRSSGPPSVVWTTSRTVTPPVPARSGIPPDDGPGRSGGALQLATQRVAAP